MYNRILVPIDLAVPPDFDDQQRACAEEAW